LDPVKRTALRQKKGKGEEARTNKVGGGCFPQNDVSTLTYNKEGGGTGAKAGS